MVLSAGLLPAAAAQAPPPKAPPPRSPLPALTGRPSQEEELLVLLRKIREAKKAALEKARAFREEKKALDQEIRALRLRLEREEKEKARLEASRREKEARARTLREEARKKAALLEKAARAGKAALERLGRLPLLAGRAPLPRPPKEPDKIPSYLERVFLRLETAAGRARSVEARRKKGAWFGKETYLDFLRLGGLTVLWRSLDGREAGWVEPGTGRLRSFPPGKKAFFSREIGRALEILARRTTPELCVLPLPAPPAPGKDGKPTGKEEKR